MDEPHPLREPHYILVGREVRPIYDLMEWARRFEPTERHVGSTHVGRYWVSTVFLGINHRFGPGRPILFETMVFNNYDGKRGDDLDFERYCTYAEAEAGHARIVRRWRLSVPWYNRVWPTTYRVTRQIWLHGLPSLWQRH